MKVWWNSLILVVFMGVEGEGEEVEGEWAL
jgi:hypothetical protein